MAEQQKLFDFVPDEICENEYLLIINQYKNKLQNEYKRAVLYFGKVCKEYERIGYRL